MSDLATVYSELKALLQPYAERLSVTADSPEGFSLDTRFIQKNKQPLFFGAVQIKKRYVSYHLMPVYVAPELLEGMSGGLKRRMQGKSCFNFTAVDPELLRELAELTQAGYSRYVDLGYAAEQ